MSERINILYKYYQKQTKQLHTTHHICTQIKSTTFQIFIQNAYQFLFLQSNLNNRNYKTCVNVFIQCLNISYNCFLLLEQLRNTECFTKQKDIYLFLLSIIINFRSSQCQFFSHLDYLSPLTVKKSLLTKLTVYSNHLVFYHIIIILFQMNVYIILLQWGT